MLHTIDLNDYAGAHVANDPAGRGFLLCLHFPSAEAAGHAQETLKPLESPAVAAPPRPVIVPRPTPPPPLAAGQVAADPDTGEVTRTGPGLEHLVGTKVRQRPDGSFVPADSVPTQPADLPKLPDGMDAAAPAAVATPAVPPKVMTAAEAQATLAKIGKPAVQTADPAPLDEYLGPAEGG